MWDVLTTKAPISRLQFYKLCKEKSFPSYRSRKRQIRKITRGTWQNTYFPHVPHAQVSWGIVKLRHEYLSRSKELPQYLGNGWSRRFIWKKKTHRTTAVLLEKGLSKTHIILEIIKKSTKFLCQGGWGFWHSLYNKNTNGLDLIGLSLFSAGSTVRSHHQKQTQSHRSALCHVKSHPDDTDIYFSTSQ